MMETPFLFSSLAVMATLASTYQVDTPSQS